MNLKRIASLTLSLALALGLLAGCAGGGDQTTAKTPEELAQLYADAINNSGGEQVEYNPVVSGSDAAAAADIEMQLQMLGITAEDMSAFAISMSLINVKAYGIAAIMPAEGKEQTVLDGLNAYVSNTQASFENYLADQYAVAEAATVETLEDGTILMVMCENSSEVHDAIVAALEG